MISKEYIYCPYCKSPMIKHYAIGTSGLVNTGGYENTFECPICNKSFECITEVSIRFKTKKMKQEN